MSSNLEGDLNRDGIIDEMDRVRGDLDGEIDQLGESMRNIFDWKAYVRAAPLTSVGIAAVVGYLLAPRIFARPVSVTLPEIPSEKPQTSFGQSLFGIVMAGVARAGTVYIADLLSRQLTPPEPPESRSAPAAATSGPPFDVGV